MDKNTAQVHMLFNGYVNTGVSPYSVASSVAFVRDGEARVVIDPGMVPSPRAILDPLVRTDNGVAAFTHLWWTAEGPDVDPFATDMGAIRAGRQRVLEVATLIVPGHGAPFTAGPKTPR